MEKKLKQIVPDSRTVDIDDDYAIEFWAKEFNVSQQKLKAAVNVVGNTAVDVKRELKK
ncbi:DUF3606 domain-containing protein [Mucilaginibacter sp. dw_454]|uniref:DUF3606 domain-containing protein n=1 Tax=Mucilaginibacter sp. dw_454 TaxID=2720079 RepID=UPI001BD20070|nr:DUF3606 domain-containing protein [Mucilaginibacter sp. dw_454]